MIELNTIKDRIIFYWLSLLIIGLLVTTSASVPLADKLADSAYYFFWKQSFFLILSMVLTAIVMQIPIALYQKHFKLTLFFAIFCLLLVFVPGVGHSVNGSTRWIRLGAFNFQASELSKIFYLIFLAGYLYTHEVNLRRGYSQLLTVLFIVAFISLLLILEPDLGTAVVLTFTTLVMLFIIGIRLRFILTLCLIFFSLITFIAYFSPYRWMRIIAFMNPWAHYYNSGYQLIQSLIAFGRGGIWGVGLGNSLQKLFYLPESHTDFVLAVIGEEFGFVGLCCVFFIYTMLFINCIKVARIAENKKNRFSSLLVYGIVYYLCLQTLVSIAVNLGLCPTKGLTLLFVSYGGSSLMMSCIAIGLILRVAKENKQDL